MCGVVSAFNRIFNKIWGHRSYLPTSSELFAKHLSWFEPGKFVDIFDIDSRYISIVGDRRTYKTSNLLLSLLYRVFTSESKIIADILSPNYDMMRYSNVFFIHICHDMCNVIKNVDVNLTLGVIRFSNGSCVRFHHIIDVSKFCGLECDEYINIIDNYEYVNIEDVVKFKKYNRYIRASKRIAVTVTDRGRVEC